MQVGRRIAQRLLPDDRVVIDEEPRRLGRELEGNPGWNVIQNVPDEADRAAEDRLGAVATHRGIHAPIVHHADVVHAAVGLESSYLVIEHAQRRVALADLVGLDVVWAILDSLHREFGQSHHKPCLEITKRVEAGHLGVKTKRGFYTY